MVKMGSKSGHLSLAISQNWHPEDMLIYCFVAHVCDICCLSRGPGFPENMFPVNFCEISRQLFMRREIFNFDLNGEDEYSGGGLENGLQKRNDIWSDPSFVRSCKKRP